MALSLSSVALMAAAVVALPATPAVAGPAPARLVVDAGDAGGFIPGRPVPVRVEVDTDVLVAGQLVVSTGSLHVSRPVEVAGGSGQRFELVVPTPAGQTQLGLQVTLAAGSARLVSATATLNALPDTEVVGILPELLVAQPVPGSEPLSVDAGTARFVTVTEQDLTLAPASLGPLTALALGPDDLARLSPRVHQAVLAWTSSGGRLLIDASPGDTIAGLPPGWKPSGGARSPAGQGELVLTSGAMAAGRWAGLVDPGSHSASVRGQTPGPGEPLSFALASAAGLSRLRLPWLLAFLLVYIAVVGPASFIFLRRRRRAELLWVVIPVVALVFAGSSYAIGSSARAGIRIVHGTVVDTTAGGGTALTFVGVASPGEAITRLQAPPGWVLSRYDDPNNSLSAGQSSLDAAIVDTGVEGRLRLAAGQFAIFQASGPAGFSGQLAVTARSAIDGHAEGLVTNGTPFALHDVSVLIGAAGIDVGTLAPGARAIWQITSEPPAAFGFTVEQQLWGPSASGDLFFNGGPVGGVILPGGKVTTVGGQVGTVGGRVDGASPASLPIWEYAPDGMAPGSRGNGVAVAVGWTDQFRPPVTIAGHGQPTKGGTGIVGTGPVEAGSSVGDFAVERRVIRGALTQIGPGMFMNNNGAVPTVAAWTLPPAAGGHRLSLSVPAGTSDVSVWSGKGWRTVANGGTTTAPATTTLPPVALQPGTQPPIPVPPPTAIGGFGQTTGPPTVVTLRSDDFDSINGVVYLRFGVGLERPIDLSTLSLKVLP
jgi:hypothetical protein